jgi:hypothetical protein
VAKKVMRAKNHLEALNTRIDKTLKQRWKAWIKSRKLAGLFGTEQELTAEAIKEYMDRHLVQSKIG